MISNLLEQSALSSYSLTEIGLTLLLQVHHGWNIVLKDVVVTSITPDFSKYFYSKKLRVPSLALKPFLTSSHEKVPLPDLDMDRWPGPGVLH